MKMKLFTLAVAALPVLASAKPLSESFPLGVYHGWERNAAHAKYAGIAPKEYVDGLLGICKEMNCDTIWVVNCPNDKEWLLDLTDKYGLDCLLNTGLQKYIVGGTFSGRMDDFDELAKASVETLGPHKSMMGYVLRDEPTAHCVGQLNYFADVLKRYDKTRDSLVVVSPRHFQTYLEASNLPVGCTDIYYFGGPYADGDIPFSDSLLMYRRACRMAVEQGRHHNKPVWLMPQTFAEGYGVSVVNKDFTRRIAKKGSYLIWRMCTDAETRWQIWEALRAGAKGIIMFSLVDPYSYTEEDIASGGKCEAQAKKALERGMKYDKKAFAEDTEIDPARSLMLYGLKPAHQFYAVKEAFGKIRPTKDRFLRAEASNIPVFFETVGETCACATFQEPGAKTRLGVIVSDDWKKAKTYVIRVTDNVSKVVDRVTGAEYVLSDPKDGIRTFSVTLGAGDGTIIEAFFTADEPGLLCVHEDFGRTHRHGWVNSDACTLEMNESFGFKGEHMLKLRDDYTNALPVAVYWMADLANPEGGAWNQTTMNVNKKEQRAHTWVNVKGEELSGCEIYAHMGYHKNKNAQERLVWKGGDPLPFEMPVGCGCLTVKLGSKKTLVTSMDCWMVPLKPVVPKDRPVALTGKKLGFDEDFPLGVYHGWERNQWNAEYCKLGCSEFVDKLLAICQEMNCDTIWCVNGPRKGQRKEFLEQCEKHGLKSIFNTGLENLQGYFHKEFDGDFGEMESSVARFVNEIGDSPAFWGYCTKDEPVGNLASQLDDISELVRRLDPLHRDTLPAATPPQITHYLEATKWNVICTDPYFFGGPKSRGDVAAPAEASKHIYSSKVREFLHHARLAGRKLWVMPQAYSWIKGLEWLDKDGKRWLEKGSYWIYRMPTDAEIRWQTWEAVRLGAKGIVFYVLSDSWSMDESYLTASTNAVDKAERNKAAQVVRSRADIARVPKERAEESTHEIEAPRALMLPGLEPSSQFKALGEAYGRLKPYKRMLLASNISRVKAVWEHNRPYTTYPMGCETLEVSGRKDKFAVLVNYDTDSAQELTYCTPSTVIEVKDLTTGKAYPLSEAKDGVRTFTARLRPGDGTLVKVGFRDGQAGYSLFHEDFTEGHRVGVFNEKSDGEIALQGSTWRSRQFQLKMKKGTKPDPTVPMYTIYGLASGGKSAYNTSGMNVNQVEEKGTMWLDLEGYLHGAIVTAVMKGEDGKPQRVKIFDQGREKLPVKIPPKTEFVELTDVHPSSAIWSVNAWFNPL